MEHYIASLDYKVYFFAVLFLLFVFGLSSKINVIFRSFLFSYSVFFSFILYLVFIIIDFRFDYMAGLVFELSVLIFFLVLLSRYFKYVNNVMLDYEFFLRILIFVKILMLIFLVNQSGFGMFHTDGQVRISFLGNNKYNKYIVYLWSTLSVLEAVAIASTYSTRRYITFGVFCIVLLNVIYSVLIGSKGGAVIWLVCVIALLPNSYSFYFKSAHKVLPIFLTVIGVVIYYGAMNEGLELGDFLNLAFNRFFLNNDSRALSLDYSSAYDGFDLFLVHSFRGVANFIGLPIIDPPLGNLLFEYQFGVVDGRGGNASYSALMNYYLEPHLRFLVALFSVLILIFLTVVIYFIERFFSSAKIKVLVVVMGANLIMVISQDFLAFPLVLVSSVLLLFVFILFRNTRLLGVCYER